jgi:pimeloyl-ACP methyl ester carboxylesterase
MLPRSPRAPSPLAPERIMRAVRANGRRGSLRVTTLAVSVLATLAACDGGTRTPTVVLGPNEAVIGPDGGAIVLDEGMHAGAALLVPPGAVAVPTRFAIETDRTNPQILSLFPVYRFTPAGVTFAVPVQVTVPAGEALFATSSGAGIACFRQREPGGGWGVLQDSVLDATARTVTASATSLGDVVAWNGSLHRLFTQDRAAIEPATPAPSATFDVPVLVDGGTEGVQVGRGSLASFWSSPAGANVLVLHGFLGSPMDFVGAQDLVASLPASVQNVVLYSYPSSPGVATAANVLYDTIQRQRGSAFGCAIVAHSMGGLVARYLLERSADDPARAGYRPEDEPLSPLVPQLVLLGVPNGGSALGDVLSQTLLPHVSAAELPLLRAVIDLSYRPDAITMALNATYVDNATRYHVVYGDLGLGTDGVVTVASALALPLFGAETATAFPVGHGELHTAAGANGVAAWIATLLQAP